MQITKCPPQHSIYQSLVMRMHLSLGKTKKRNEKSCYGKRNFEAQHTPIAKSLHVPMKFSKM